MTIRVTARHFKAHDTLTDYAERSVEELTTVYDGILRADIILSFEKARNSVKNAEINLKVYNATLTGKGSAEEFPKAIDGALAKVLVQLKKYKEKLKAKPRKGAQRKQIEVS